MKSTELDLRSGTVQICPAVAGLSRGIKDRGQPLSVLCTVYGVVAASWRWPDSVRASAHYARYKGLPIKNSPPGSSATERCEGQHTTLLDFGQSSYHIGHSSHAAHVSVFSSVLSRIKDINGLVAQAENATMQILRASVCYGSLPAEQQQKVGRTVPSL